MWLGESSFQRSTASTLTSELTRYRKAIHERRGNLIVANHLYQDIMNYQWQLDAIEAELQATDAAVAAEVEAPNSATDVEARTRAVTGSLQTIRDQHVVAMQSFEARASDYALILPSSHGGIERVAKTKLEKQAAVEWQRQFVMQTYADLGQQVSEILKVEPGAGGLERLKSTLERRRDFFNEEMEEAWTAWNQATVRTYAVGDEIVDAWAKISIAFSALCRGRWPDFLGPKISGALASVVACELVVGFVDSLGISGLIGRGSESFGDPSVPGDFAPEARLGVLVTMTEVLSSNGSLAMVWSTLVQGDLPQVPDVCSALDTVIGILLPALETGAGRPQDCAPHRWAVCLAHGFVENTSRASASGNDAHVIVLRRLCVALCGNDFSSAVDTAAATLGKKSQVAAATVSCATTESVGGDVGEMSTAPSGSDTGEVVDCAESTVHADDAVTVSVAASVAHCAEACGGVDAVESSGVPCRLTGQCVETGLKTATTSCDAQAGTNSPPQTVSLQCGQAHGTHAMDVVQRVEAEPQVSSRVSCGETFLRADAQPTTLPKQEFVEFEPRTCFF